MITLSHSDMYAFVHTLTKSEKRFFKLQTVGHPKYEFLVNLFDFFDKKASKHGMQQEGYTKTENPAKTSEHYYELYEQILRSQRLFYADTILNFRIKDDIDNLYVLYNKGQYKQCLKMLKALKQVVLENEKFHFALEVIDLEKELNHKSQIASRTIDELSAEEQNLVLLEKNLSDYISLYARLNQLIKVQSIEPQKRDYTEAYYEILNDPILMQSGLTQSVKSELLYHKSRGLCYTKLGNEAEREKHFIACYNLFEKHPFLNQEMPRIRLEVYYQLINHYLETDKHDLCRQYISRFSGMSKKHIQLSIDVQSKYDSYLLNSRLLLAIDVNDRAEATQVAGLIEKHLSANQENISKEDHLVLLFNLVNYFLIVQNYNKARVNNTFMLSLCDKDTRRDIQHYGRLQQLIVLYELYQMPQFYYMLGAMRRQTPQIPSQSETEKLVLEAFQNLSGKGADRQHFENLHKKLAKLSSAAERRINKFYVDFLRYTQQKVSE